MKKRFNFGRLGALTLALTLITTCLMGGTLAKYTTTVTGTGSADVAKWSFKVNKSNTEFQEIKLSDTVNYTNVKEKTIAPGTAGSFKLELDGFGSDVGIDYTVVIKNGSDEKLPEALEFKINDGQNNHQYELTKEHIGSIAYSPTESDMKKTLTVSWVWPYGSDEQIDNNYAGKAWTLDISVTGTQTTPVAP